MVLLSNWAQRWQNVLSNLIHRISLIHIRNSEKVKSRLKIKKLEYTLIELSEKNRFLIQRLFFHGGHSNNVVVDIITHDIANALTNIHLAISELADEYNIGESNLYFDIINRNNLKILGSIQKLIHKPVFTELDMHSISVNDVLEDAMLTIKKEFGMYAIHIETDFSVQNPEIWADQDQIKTAFLAILANYISLSVSTNVILTIKTFIRDGKCVVYFQGSRTKKKSISRLDHPLNTGESGTYENALNYAKSIFLCNQGSFKSMNKPYPGFGIYIYFSSLPHS